MLDDEDFRRAFSTELKASVVIITIKIVHRKPPLLAFSLIICGADGYRPVSMFEMNFSHEIVRF